MGYDRAQRETLYHDAAAHPSREMVFGIDGVAALRSRFGHDDCARVRPRELMNRKCETHSNYRATRQRARSSPTNYCSPACAASFPSAISSGPREADRCPMPDESRKPSRQFLQRSAPEHSWSQAARLCRFRIADTRAATAPKRRPHPPIDIARLVARVLVVRPDDRGCPPASS